MNDDVTEVQDALLKMCEYANYLGKHMAKLGDCNYVGDFVAQNTRLIGDARKRAEEQRRNAPCAYCGRSPLPVPEATRHGGENPEVKA